MGRANSVIPPNSCGNLPPPFACTGNKLQSRPSICHNFHAWLGPGVLEFAVHFTGHELNYEASFDEIEPPNFLEIYGSRKRPVHRARTVRRTTGLDPGADDWSVLPG